MVELDSKNCNGEILKSFEPLVKFLSMSLGDWCEVVLHDTSNVEHSIIAIENGVVTGRKIGGPLTDVAIRALNEGWYKENDYIVNYQGRRVDGRPTRSCTFFIKDSFGNLLGMLCLNFDIEGILKASTILRSLAEGVVANDAGTVKANEADAFVERFPDSIDELKEQLLDGVLAGYDIPSERLTMEEKIQIVQALKKKGFFVLKGAVNEVASRLRISEASVYRYINENVTKREGF
ncbi:MAG TPA: PAS domain-containing protein [Bacillota bacterium]|nr:PAS domain-containing protein [Bacillota bacterium]